MPFDPAVPSSPDRRTQWPAGDLHHLAAYRSQLQSDAPRLFLSHETGFAIKIVECDELSLRHLLISDKASLDAYLQGATTPTTRIIMIQQQGSWGAIAISAAGMNEILNKFAVFPAFLEIARAFGRKVLYRDESFDTLRTGSSMDDAVKETAYIAKYAEQHEREDVDDRWSLRKSGIYHRSCDALGDSFIVINPSKQVQLRFKDIAARAHCLSPDSVHLAILSEALATWRWCTSDLEEQCSQMKIKAHLTHIDAFTTVDEKSEVGIKIEQIQDISVLQDKLELYQHTLGGSVHVLTQLPQTSLIKSPKSFLDLMIVASSEQARIASVLRRLSATSDLMARIVDVRWLSSLDQNSRALTDLIRVANDENSLIVELGKKASHDADVVKMLTLVALIYLPASFIAAVMSMGYISVKHNNDRRFSLEVESEFAVFVVLTAIFLAITLLGYFTWLQARKPAWSRGPATWLRRFGGA